VDGIGLFDIEMYMSHMHGGHGGNNTLSFKRCLLLKYISAADIANILTSALGNWPLPLCYLRRQMRVNYRPVCGRSLPSTNTPLFAVALF
jgi:hypothetical protein